MQATLIYNPNSGGTSQATPDDILVGLRGVGYEPVHLATSSEADLDRVLNRVDGLLVVAGGDGSVRAVATRLIGRKLPLALLPMGTANNIARTLGLHGSPLEIVAGLGTPEKVFFDVGRVRSPWGVDYFLEAFGFGLYAEILAIYDPEKGKSIIRSIGAINQVIRDFAPIECKMKLDGQEIIGEYLLVALLNTTAFGPRIKVAPEASTSDGILEVVLFHADNRDSLIAYLTSIVAERLAELPSVDVLCGKKLEVEWPGFTIHVDAEVRPDDHVHPANLAPARGWRWPWLRRRNRLTVDVLAQTLEFWLPHLPEKPPNNQMTSEVEQMIQDARTDLDSNRLTLGM